MSVEQTLFETYQGFDIQDTVEACKVTKENLPNDPNKEYVACPGDYLMQDLAGHYLVIPREIFEKRYAKRV
jgi:hypothetical protein